MKYHLLLKTGQAEIRAWKNLSVERRAQVRVHCEITRGRKKRNSDKNAAPEYEIGKVLDSIATSFQDCDHCTVDITREDSLTSNETAALSSCDNQYGRWRSTIDALHQRNPNVRPTLIVNPNHEDDYTKYSADLVAQFLHFAERYDRITYRASVVHDADFIQDIDLLKDYANAYTDGGGVFEVALDFEYVHPSTAPIHASFAAPIVRDIRELVPQADVVCYSTSFPKSVTDIGDERTDTFRLEEVLLHEALTRLHNAPIGYGDYGSINPIRNDVFTPVGPHLRARVDFPTNSNTIYYYRVDPIVDKATNKLLYPRSFMYRDAARLVKNDPQFSFVSDSWGYQRIVEAAGSLPEGSSADYWISVRMEIHVCRQLDRIARMSAAVTHDEVGTAMEDLRPPQA